MSMEIPPYFLVILLFGMRNIRNGNWRLRKLATLWLTLEILMFGTALI